MYAFLEILLTTCNQQIGTHNINNFGKMEIQLKGTHLTETLQWFLPTCPYQLRKEAKCMHANMAKINLKVT